MDTSVWACCGVVGAFMIYYPFSIFLSKAYPKSVAISRRYISHPQILRKLRLGSIRGRKLSVNIHETGIVTPLYIIIATVVFILNVVVLALSAKSRNLLIRRSGRVLVFNLCILIVSGRQSLFSDSLGIAYEFQAFFHRWLGRVVFLVGIIHVVIALVPYQTGGAILSPRPRIAGFTATLALFALILSSFSPVRRTFYEVFRYCHVFFAAVIVVAGFFHLTPIGVSKPSVILFIITASMYFLLFSMRTGMLIIQRAPVLVDQGDGLIKIELRLLKPIRVSAGQHIWLRIPSVSYTSFAESHPFAIASWEKAEDGKAERITILVDPKRGFTKKLSMLVNHDSLTFQHLDRLMTDKKAESKLYRELGAIANIEAKVLKELRARTRARYNQLENDIRAELMLFKRAFFDGPYGRPIRAEEFGTVILYATGIGIGAQLATVKHLLESREAGTAKTQRVTLLWEVDHVFVGYDAENEKHSVKDDTAQQMVKRLLQQDCDRLSRLRLDPAATFQYRSGWQGAPPEQGYMFRCTRYVRNKPQNIELDLDENDEDNHSSTDTLRTRYRELNPEASLESQLQHDNCRGRVLVSVCANPEFADSIRNIVATKGLHLHEHEFRPERWPRMKREQGTDGWITNTGQMKNLLDMQIKGIAGNEYSAG